MRSEEYTLSGEPNVSNLLPSIYRLRSMVMRPRTFIHFTGATYPPPTSSLAADSLSMG
jgi:hypothetical protein